MRTIILLSLLASGLAGCQQVRDERTVLLDPGLSGTLEMEARDPKWADGGLLLARATIHNRTSDSLHLLVQTTFFDADGVPLQGNPPWENVIVPEYGSYNHNRTATDDQAVDYRIQVRAGKSN